MRPSPRNVFVRANYLAIVAFGPLLALLLAAYLLSTLFRGPEVDWPAVAIVSLPTVILYLLPGTRAFAKIVFPMMIALLSYLIALWSGEIALVGDGVSDKARASRSAAL